MTALRKSVLIIVVIQCIHFCCGQVLGNPVKPNFPPVFQVEVQGIFKDEKKEMVGTIYYDSINNRAAFHFTYEGVTTQSIYRFNDDELLQISDTNCTVKSIRADSVNRFFPFSADSYGKSNLAKPDELFFFTNSIFKEEKSYFPSYVYKAKLNSALYEGSNCEVTHIFTKPEMKVPECNSSVCQTTLATMSITCLDNDGNLKVDKTYDFFRQKSNIIDTNVFLPPSGVFCSVKNKSKFPGLPAYFSFTYDMTEESKGTDRALGSLTVYKKVWYDSKMGILRMDEFDAERLQISSRIFDINGGVSYTSRTSLSACEMVSINNQDVPLDEMTKLPKVFFQGENALSKAVYVGTRRVNGLEYEVWSLAIDKQSSTKIVQEFYFTKTVSKTGVPDVLKLTRAEIYTYQANTGNMKSELLVSTSLPVNNFIDRLRWEAFDVSRCFKTEQKKEFRLKVNGPPTQKDSKTFQEVLNQLYLKLTQSANISATRLSNLACVHDGVKIIEFTGLILDKPNVISSNVGKPELDINEAFRMINYLAGNGKLFLKMTKDGQIVDYKITGMEEIKIEEEDKNLYSGGVVAGFVFGGMTLGMILGMLTCYKCSKIAKEVEERELQAEAPVKMTETEN